jgi:hypothetical protein
VADGVEVRWAPFLAYFLTATEAGRATGGDFYAGCAELTRCAVMWPGKSTVPTRLWSRLRDGDGFAPGDGNRASERARRAEREAERQAPPPAPKWRPRNVAEFVTSARREHTEHIAGLWRDHHGAAAVRVEDIAHDIVNFVAGAGAAEATPPAIGGAINWHMAGRVDAEGRRFGAIEEDAERRPRVLGYRFLPVPQRETPTEPALIPWRDRMAQREAELLDDPAFRSGEFRDSRVRAAQNAAWQEGVAAYAAEVGGEREALRRFAVGGLHR